MNETHPLYGNDPTRNGDFGYTLPPRTLGNWELQQFFKLAEIPIRYARWYTRHGSGKVVQSDWCWQNYCAGYEYGERAGYDFIDAMSRALDMTESQMFIACGFGRSSIQFTFTPKAERRVLDIIERQTCAP